MLATKSMQPPPSKTVHGSQEEDDAAQAAQAAGSEETAQAVASEVWTWTDDEEADEVDSPPCASWDRLLLTNPERGTLTDAQPKELEGKPPQRDAAQLPQDAPTCPSRD